MSEGFASLSDKELMFRLRLGQIEPLGELYVRHISMVKTAMRRFAPELPNAKLEEMLQDVFLALYDSAARYQEQTKFKAWLYGIAVRTVRNWRRTAWLHRRILKEHQREDVGMAWETNTSPAELAEAREEVSQALSHLPRGQREVLILHVAGFKGEEIAEILSLRSNTVWSRLHRARQTLINKTRSNIKETLGREEQS